MSLPFWTGAVGNNELLRRFNDSDRPEPDLTDYFTNEAVKAVAANKNQPFFLYLARGAFLPGQPGRI